MPTSNSKKFSHCVYHIFWPKLCVHFLVLPYKPCLCRHSSLVRPNSLISDELFKVQNSFCESRSCLPLLRLSHNQMTPLIPSSPHTTYMCPAPCTKEKTKCCTHTEHQMKLFISFTGAYSPGWTFGLPFRGFLITYIIRHTVELLWTSDQSVAEASTYPGQHNI
jgi:hypothetical protein